MTIRTSSADKNFYSISKNIVELYAGTVNAITKNSLPIGTIISTQDFIATDPTNWSAIIKVCDDTNGISILGFKSSQGMENVLDCNCRTNNCKFDGEYGQINQTGDQVITVKGGCHDLVFNGIIQSNGNNADIVIGAWSDQSYNKSYNLDFSGLKRFDGKPLTFVLCRCNNIKLPSNAKIKKILSIEYVIYWWTKWFLVKTGIFNLFSKSA